MALKIQVSVVTYLENEDVISVILLHRLYSASSAAKAEPCWVPTYYRSQSPSIGGSFSVLLTLYFFVSFQGNGSGPRLTEFLRSAFPDQEENLSPLSLGSDLHALRESLLRQRRRWDKEAASNDPIRSRLISRTIGSWNSSKKDARNAFKEYLRAVATFLGGEVSAEELSAAAETIWMALSTLPPIDQETLQRHGTVRNAAFGPAKQRLKQTYPTHDIDANAVNMLLDVYDRLCLIRQEVQADHTASRGGKALEETFYEPDRETRVQKTASSMQNTSLSLAHFDEDIAVLAACGVAATSPAAIRFLQYVEGQPAQIEQRSESYSERKNIEYADEDIKEIEAQVFGGRKGMVSDSSVFDARWLCQWCSSVNPASCETDLIPTSVAMLILSDKTTDDTLAAELYDLLGEGVFEKIGELLERRPSLAQNLRNHIAEIRAEEGDDDKESSKIISQMPKYGTGVSVLSEAEKAAMKAERKAERRRRQLQQQSERPNDDVEREWLSLKGLKYIADYEAEKEASRGKLILGNGVEFRVGSSGAGLRPTLPKGTSRKTYKGYEEVYVPAIPTGQPRPGEKMVMISELPEWAQVAFAGYASLNRIQSAIFETAWRSNENMLVCAPTGAGKTNIAMLSVLHELSQHIESEGSETCVKLSDFKIVYVAPMKALAAEVTASFSRRLAPLGLKVRELTGDMQLSKREMVETQMIVTTPEKWDVITRKGGEVGVASLVRLLIIDEVHLLNDERGPVIETLVARTTRQVETSQSMIRMIGLSATLPNYKDVASFLGVNLETGLFYFDASYRPVPLETFFVGVSEKNFTTRQALMDDICYQKVSESLKKGHQAMVFVHSRKETGKTARMLALKAQQHGETALFDCSSDPGFGLASKEAKKSRSREVADLFDAGVGIHHAGLLRTDRSLTERLFSSGLLRVLCCTATLAWGVNLPAHTVIIKGTQLYNPQKGGFTDLGMLDVQQIFGRAGRPQYEDSGEAVIVTTHDKLAHYLGMITHTVPIESQFVEGLADHLNAEIVLGTVTNVREAVTWLGYTYLYVRMTRNPLAYGVSWDELATDPSLERHRYDGSVFVGTREVYRSHPIMLHGRIMLLEGLW